MLKSRSAKYLVGIGWFVLSLVVSNLNDVTAKYLGSDIHPAQVAFLRFLFGTLSLLPFMFYYGKTAFKTSRPLVHVARGTLLFFGITIWILGLGYIQITAATILTFTIPLFILVLAPIFLNEKVPTRLWGATLIGFAGVLVILNPLHTSFNAISMIMLLSAVMFASLDIINKKFVIQESMLSMLFYSAVVTTILGFYPAYLFWQPITHSQLYLLCALGAGSNLILFFLLKAFSLVNASDVAPYRYLELVISAFFGFIIFAEIPTLETAIGACIIIPTTLYIAYQKVEQLPEKEVMVANT
ncbi:MAG: DMT family transporter [Rickettsiales bacterium]